MRRSITYIIILTYNTYQKKIVNNNFETRRQNTVIEKVE